MIYDWSALISLKATPLSISENRWLFWLICIIGDSFAISCGSMLVSSYSTVRIAKGESPKEKIALAIRLA
jgi:hypothetical protein